MDARATALCQRAEQLKQAGNFTTAYATYIAATRTDNNIASAWVELGDALRAEGKVELSLICHRKALALEPSVLQHLRYANALASVLRYDEADWYFRKTIKLDSSYSKAWYGLFYIYWHTNHPREARKYLDRAMRIDPNVAEMIYASATFELSQGNWLRGFGDEYEAREIIQQVTRGGTNKPKNIPLWTGQSLKGKTLYIYSEQGFGDVIMFLRFLKRLPRCDLVVMVPKEMRQLIDFSFEGNGIHFHNNGTEIPPADYCLAMGSIPRLTMNSRFTVESEPYLFAPDDIFIGAKNAKNVGVVWAGDRKHQNDRWRSATPEDFVIGLSRPGIELYSLQISNEPVDPALMGDMGLMQNMAPRIRNWMDTAIIVNQLDCVVSVDTGVANLCGAMGKPCHVLVPYGGIDWRWKCEGDYSPWYPSVRIHRQKKGETWRSVLERVALWV